MLTKRFTMKLWIAALFSLLTSVNCLHVEAKEGGTIGRTPLYADQGGHPDGGGTVGKPTSFKLTVARGGSIGRSARSGGGTIG